MSAEMQQPMLSVDDARRLTERIRLTAHSARESIEKLNVLVAQAKDGNAHLALGYASWTAYLSEVLGEEPLRLARDQRQELVGYLAGEGMSTRAIAPIVGASQKTVDRDIREVAGESNDSPDEEWRCETCNGVDSVGHDDPEDCHCGCELDADCRGIEPGDAARSVVAAAFAKRDEPEPPAKVTGLDGKTYSKPAPKAEPRQPNRRALPDQARSAGWELRKSVERLERIAADDRFTANKEAMAPHLRSHLSHAIEVCQDLLDRISQ